MRLLPVLLIVACSMKRSGTAAAAGGVTKKGKKQQSLLGFFPPVAATGRGHSAARPPPPLPVVGAQPHVHSHGDVVFSADPRTPTDSGDEDHVAQLASSGAASLRDAGGGLGDGRTVDAVYDDDDHDHDHDHADDRGDYVRNRYSDGGRYATGGRTGSRGGTGASSCLIRTEVDVDGSDGENDEEGSAEVDDRGNVPDLIDYSREEEEEEEDDDDDDVDSGFCHSSLLNLQRCSDVGLGIHDDDNFDDDEEVDFDDGENEEEEEERDSTGDIGGSASVVVDQPPCTPPGIVRNEDLTPQNISTETQSSSRTVTSMHMKAAVGSFSLSNLTTCSCRRLRKLLFVPAPSHLVKKCPYLPW